MKKVINGFTDFVNEELSDAEQRELSDMGFRESRQLQWEGIIDQIEELAGQLEELLDGANDEAEMAMSSLGMAVSDLRDIEID